MVGYIQGIPYKEYGGYIMAKFKEELYEKEIKKLRTLINELPAFTSEFFTGIDHTTTLKTKVEYAIDLKIFFYYLQEQESFICPSTNTPKVLKDFSLEDIASITPKQIEMFLSHLNHYTGESGIERSNGNYGKMHKLATLRSFYNYYLNRGYIRANPALVIDMPRLGEKHIVKLDADEVARLLDEIDSGENLTEKQQIYHKRNRLRDLAIVSLLLGTGMRVSECVGINLEDIDFNNNGIVVTVKGQNQRIIYFGKEVEKALKEYIVERGLTITTNCHIKERGPLFVYKDNRISVKSVQRLVKKYSELVTRTKKITPHKLRSTFGTQVYRETGDIYLVADLLGHADVNVTRKHYTSMDDDRRRKALVNRSLRGGNLQ